MTTTPDPITATADAEETVEGPYFDVNERHNRLAYRRESSARICCDYVLDGNFDLAKKYAEEVEEYDAEMRRILHWAISRDEAGGRSFNAPRWIGM